MDASMKYELSPLPYSYDALEPVIDRATMEIHHGKHHQAYVNNLNAVLENHPELGGRSLEDLTRECDNLPLTEGERVKFRNNGGGHLNHTLFWEVMDPRHPKAPDLVREIEQEFRSVEEFKKAFSQCAANHFGSGWAWLARDAAGKLLVYSLPNQDSPHLKGHTPLLGLDVWEHAYYLKYQNRRAEYIENWWKVVKWIS